MHAIDAKKEFGTVGSGDVRANRLGRRSAIDVWANDRATKTVVDLLASHTAKAVTITHRR